ncbi:MAG: LON peptidase substrate-binding domain-containing protein, partial [Bacteroidales bacterium]|nr:LON peptidase substrate-binding domain-containing protein [Bacteroidales bacterium]
MIDFNKEMFPASSHEVNIIPVMSGEPALNFDASELPGSLPILALRNAVIFPGVVFPITIGREKSMLLVDKAQGNGMFIGAVPQKNVAEENPLSLADFSEFGTVVKVLKTFEMPDGTVTALLQGYKRLRMLELTDTDPYHMAR